MTDNSDIVLHWEIDNARAILATGKAESKVFDEGGFKWAASVERSCNTIDFMLRCDSDDNGHWKCDVKLGVHVLDTTSSYQTWILGHFCFDAHNCTYRTESFLSWSLLNYPVNFSTYVAITDEMYNINDKVTVEVRIKIVSSERHDTIVDTAKFTAPNRMSNVILKIGENKLHVSKEFLAVHSPVFEALFFGDFAEKGKEEVELKDVVYEEFLDLLHLTYIGTMEITDRNVQHILKLADRFQMDGVINLSKKHLMVSKEFNEATKFLLADQYRLSSLREHCLKSFTTASDVTAKLIASPEYVNFSADAKVAICDRISDLSSQMIENSNFILRWEIENVRAKAATGKVESGVFNEGGFRWTAVMEKRAHHPDDRIDFTVRCDSDNNRPWKRELEVDVHVLCCYGSYGRLFQEPFIFDHNNGCFVLRGLRYPYLTNPAYNINDKVTMEFRINIISVERDEPVPDTALFTGPNRKSNVIVKIGEKKLHVSKELLAIHSPVFETLFFGDFAEKGKEEVEIKDVKYEEFVDILHLMYPGVHKITDRTVNHTLKLADQFQMEGLLKMANEHLIQASRLDVAKKLLLADQYRLVSLRDHCIQSFTTSNDIINQLKPSPEYANFSGDMKGAILDRVMKLHLQ